tara:strand:- start:6098 stop:6322 length:225 start_codon:yes stop_codon:yes gene_type:complete
MAIFGLFFLLGIPLFNDWSNFSGKLLAQDITKETLIASMELMLGVSSSMLGIILILIIFIGTVQLFTKNKDLFI